MSDYAVEPWCYVLRQVALSDNLMLFQLSAMVENSSNCHPLDSRLCFSRASVYLFTVYFILSLPLLPLYTCVFVQVYRQWRRRRSTPTWMTVSHTDVMTYHMTVLEVVGLHGSLLYGYSTLTGNFILLWWGAVILYISSSGQTLFHLLTCMERYLAIVHPVTYVGLKQRGGVRLRNAFICCVWLLCFGSLAFMTLSWTYYVLANFFLLILTLVIVSFCSLLVIRALTHPRPGKVGGNKEPVDQSKQKAISTIVLILLALAIRFLSSMVVQVMNFVNGQASIDLLSLMWSSMLLSLPSRLVLPLLFLQKAEKN